MRNRISSQVVNRESPNELTRRQQALLVAAVHRFVATAAPVGSHQVAGQYRLGVRAATVRTMMAELEDAGYFYQPHTSAGRIPTEKAFRYYVDNLVPFARLGLKDRAHIELHYSAASRDIAEVMRETPRLLALLTGQAAIVMAPRPESMNLEGVQFVRVRERQVLAVFFAVGGGVHHCLVGTDNDHSQEELERMACYLNESLHGRTLQEARCWIEDRLKEERARYDRFLKAALELGGAMAERAASVDVYVEGSARALEQPEFADPDKMRELVRALEDKTALLKLLERSLSQPYPTVSIGSENFDRHLAAFSVVAAPYQRDSLPLGSVAVVGPMRMDYGRVVPVVDYTARALSRLLGG